VSFKLSSRPNKGIIKRLKKAAKWDYLGIFQAAMNLR